MYVPKDVVAVLKANESSFVKPRGFEDDLPPHNSSVSPGGCQWLSGSCDLTYKNMSSPHLVKVVTILYTCSKRGPKGISIAHVRDGRLGVLTLPPRPPYPFPHSEDKALPSSGTNTCAYPSAIR